MTVMEANEDSFDAILAPLVDGGLTGLRATIPIGYGPFRVAVDDGAVVLARWSDGRTEALPIGDVARRVATGELLDSIEKFGDCVATFYSGYWPASRVAVLGADVRGVSELAVRHDLTIDPSTLDVAEIVGARHPIRDARGLTKAVLASKFDGERQRVRAQRSDPGWTTMLGTVAKPPSPAMSAVAAAIATVLDGTVARRGADGGVPACAWLAVRVDEAGDWSLLDVPACVEVAGRPMNRWNALHAESVRLLDADSYGTGVTSSRSARKVDLVGTWADRIEADRSSDTDGPDDRDGDYYTRTSQRFGDLDSAVDTPYVERQETRAIEDRLRDAASPALIRPRGSASWSAALNRHGQLDPTATEAVDRITLRELLDAARLTDVERRLVAIRYAGSMLGWRPTTAEIAAELGITSARGVEAVTARCRRKFRETLISSVGFEGSAALTK